MLNEDDIVMGNYDEDLKPKYSQNIPLINWINLKSKQPEIGQLCICYDPNLVIPYQVAAYLPFKEGEKSCYFSSGSYIGFNVTHWHPINKP